MVRQPETALPDGGRYATAAGRIMARSAIQQGAIADQRAGDAAAELGLRRTAALTAALGRPQDELSVVHVAGSKGKGSTAAFISSILVAGGVRTGRFTSPHLAKLTERIAIDERDIDDRLFAATADQVLAAADALERDRPDLGPVNAFEVLFGMALVAFREAGCRVAVVEVGIGGRLDTTNIVAPAVSVITTLDLEHTAILGDTLAEIATEKAGIIKPGRPVIVAPQPEEAMSVIRNRSAAMGSRLTLVDERTAGSIPDGIGLTGRHQRVNAALAVAAVHELGRWDHRLAVDEPAVRLGLSRAWLPGRFEIVPPAVVRRFTGLDPTQTIPGVVLDGAHTAKSAEALRVALDAADGRSNAVIAVCGLAGDKDIRAFLVALGPAGVLPVAAASPRAVPAAGIAAVARDLGLSVLDGPDHVPDALTWLLRSGGVVGPVVVTGSFAVVAEARTAFGLPAVRPGPPCLPGGVDSTDVQGEPFGDETNPADRP